MNKTELDNATAPRSVDQQQACSGAYISGNNKFERSLNKALVARNLAVDVRGSRKDSGRRVNRTTSLKGNLFALGLGELGE